MHRYLVSESCTQINFTLFLSHPRTLSPVSQCQVLCMEIKYYCFFYIVAPSPPSKIEVTEDESNDVEITFTWTSSPGAEFYRPTLVRPDGIELSHPDGDVPATSPLVTTFKGLQSGTAYELIVRSGLYLFSQFPEILSRAVTTEHTTGTN